MPYMQPEALNQLSGDLVAEARVAQLLFVTPDRKEGQFLIQHPNQGYHFTRKQFGFLAFRFIQFRENVQLVSWCMHCACGSAGCKGPDELLEGADYAHLSPSDILGQQPCCHCPAASAILHTHGGEQALRQLLREHVVAGTVPSSTDHPSNGNGSGQRARSSPVVVKVTIRRCDAYTAVSAPIPAFGNWGVVQQQPSGSIECTSPACSRHRAFCEHATGLGSTN